MGLVGGDGAAGRFVRHSLALLDVAALSGGDDQAKRATERIDEPVTPGGQSACGMPRLHHSLQEGSRLGRGHFRHAQSEGVSGGPVNGRGKACHLGTHFGNVDVEVPDRMGLEGLLREIAALIQPSDPVTLETAMERGARQIRNRGLQGVEAIILQQQQHVPEDTMIIASSESDWIEHGSNRPVLISSSVPPALLFNPSWG